MTWRIVIMENVMVSVSIQMSWRYHAVSKNVDIPNSIQVTMGLFQ